jgi:pyruvate formate lyase activating enzyme
VVAPAATSPQACVLDIQHYAVHDGPGIRTAVFLKGCPLRCVWCANPESQRSEPELRHRAARCSGCLSCAAACPAGAIDRGPTGLARIARGACASCRARPCVAHCPEGALVLAGQLMTAAACLDAVGRDLPFYRASGGGVTVSGGEPLLWPDFTRALLAGCRERAIPCLVETAGDVTPAAWDVALQLAELIYFDVKAADDAVYEQLTGRRPERVWCNLARVAAERPEALVLRAPIVPGVNDDEASLAALVELAAAHRPIAVQLVPYHGLGVGKYAELDRPYPLARELGPSSPAALRAIADRFRRAGLTCYESPR